MSEIQVGAKAPAFTAAAVGGKYDGQIVSLSDLKGKTVVLYFYPKDDTPGEVLPSVAQAAGLLGAAGGFVLGIEVEQDDVLAGVVGKLPSLAVLVFAGDGGGFVAGLGSRGCVGCGGTGGEERGEDEGEERAESFHGV